MKVCGDVLGWKSLGKYWDASLWGSIGMQVCGEVLGCKSVVKYWDASLWGSPAMQVCGQYWLCPIVRAHCQGKPPPVDGFSVYGLQCLYCLQLYNAQGTTVKYTMYT